MIQPTKFSDDSNRMNNPKIATSLNLLKKETLEVIKKVLDEYNIFFDCKENLVKSYINDNTSYSYELNVPEYFNNPAERYKFYNKIYDKLVGWKRSDIKVIGRHINTDRIVIYVNLTSSNTIFKFAIYQGDTFVDDNMIQLRIQYLLIYGCGDELYGNEILIKILTMFGEKIGDVVCTKDRIEFKDLYFNSNLRLFKTFITKELLKEIKFNRKFNKLHFDIAYSKNNIVINFY